MLGACVGVASLETAVPPRTEVFEPRLLGNWEIREDSFLTSRVVVTQEAAALYLVRYVQVHGDSAVLMGRLGPLGTRRWILELSPVGDTLQYVRSPGSRDSSRLAPPSHLLMMPVHMPLVIERADSGLRFAAFNGDSLQAYLTSRRLRTPFAVKDEGFVSTVLLTEREPRSLNSSLQEFAERPGALVPLPRIGHRISAPAWH
jgi:hypothetical protein